MTAIDFFHKLRTMMNVSQNFCSKSQTVHIIQNETQTLEYIIWYNSTKQLASVISKDNTVDYCKILSMY